MSEFDFQHAYEVCPHCNEEIMLEPELKIQTCPHCGKRIVTCSMCRACETGENYCSKCCLEYQARKENEEMEEERERKLAHQYGEVRCDFFDEASGYWLVDAWKSDDDDEGGVVVAKINPATFETIYVIPLAEKDELVREVVRNKLREILKELFPQNF